MDLQNLKNILEDTFSANFVVYYRAHQAHVNVIGRNFYNDHKLLKHVYTELQEHIDDIGEKLRTVKSHMPMSLMHIINTSPIIDYPADGSSEDLLRSVLAGVENLIDQYHLLRSAADAVNYTDISNMADENIGELAKMKWQLEATLGEDLE
jgi:starvation-inducible DNA-binding protein